MSDTLKELTNKFIDKELSKHEELQLIDLLKDNDNKIYFELLTKTINILETNRPEEHEIDIKDAVIQKINIKKKETISTKLKSYFSKLFNGTSHSYAASFAIGGLFVAVIFMLLPANTQVNDTFMQGVMANSNNDDTHFINEGPFSGAIKVQYSSNVVVLDIDLSSSEIIDCRLTFNKDQLSFYGVKAVKSNGNSNFSSGGNLIQLSDISSNHYLVFLKKVNNNFSQVMASFYKTNELLTNISLEINN